MTLEMSSDRLNLEIARFGRILVARLFVLLKTSLNYSEGHAALDAPAANVLKVLQEISRRNEEASLRVKGGHLYLGELRLKSDASGFESGRFVMEEMKRHNIGGVCFSLAVTAGDLSGFAFALREAAAAPSAEPYRKVLGLMQQRMIVNVQVEAVPETVEMVEIDKEKLQDGKMKARLLYRKAVSVMDEVMANATQGQPLRLREAKRVVQHMIDLLPGYQSSLLGMATTRCHEAYTQNHAANVCILSLAVGERLRMSKFHLCELGMAALFHDIGKADIPREILDKPEELSPEERQTLEAHPLHGVRKVMKLKGLDAMSSRIITGVFEHHMLADFSGYPQLPYKTLSLFGRIIGIAENYDALTSSRVNGRISYPPDKALRYMLSRAGKAFDLALLKLFINCVGMHGIGSLLLLDSRELAVVVENNPDPARYDSPLVRIISDANGQEVDGGVVDLALCEPPRMICANLDPHHFDLNVRQYFL
jgi:HD-GYP domain-containing protein (c-di-GMP phosphodiesterase class II)